MVAENAGNKALCYSNRFAKLISEQTQRRHGREALRLYNKLREEGVIPNTYTLVAALKACTAIADLECGKHLHSHVMEGGHDANIFVASTLIGMYSNCGSLLHARLVFEQMLHRDTVSWNAMIMGCAHMEFWASALDLYACMQHSGFIPNARTFVVALKACSGLAAAEGEETAFCDAQIVKKRCLEQGKLIHSHIVKRGLDSHFFVASALVDMYAKCGSITDARRIFDNMAHHDVVSWTSMIMGYAQMEMGEVALQLYAQMKTEGFQPDAHTFVAALKACSSLTSLKAGRELHAQIYGFGLENNVYVATCLIDMYSKCGSMMQAQKLFDALPVRSTVTWDALIAGYGGQGDSNQVLDLFTRMQQEGVQPDEITFLLVLNVCSHTGLVDRGQRYFHAMCLSHGINPSMEHYRCIVDLLGRAGNLDEAVALMKKMPFKPELLTWLTILGACQKWHHVEVGRHAFNCAVRLDGKDAAAYVLMTNIYEFAQMWEESSNIQEMRKKAGALKKPEQCRCRDAAGIVHTYLADHIRHLQSQEIMYS